MTPSPLPTHAIRALLDSMERLDSELRAQTGLTASLATTYRVQGALVALQAVLGVVPSDAVAKAMTQDG